MTIVGIDIGLTGAIAWNDGAKQSVVTMPTISAGGKCKLMVDERGLVDLLSFGDIDNVFIEKAGAMPKQGVTSCFNFGATYGLIRGVLAGLNIPYRIVRPQEWKKVVLAGSAKDKQAAILHCQRAYPGVSLLKSERCRVPHDGMADALCIAEYGWRIMKGGI